jgi:hypothetical protein
MSHKQNHEPGIGDFVGGRIPPMQALITLALMRNDPDQLAAANLWTKALVRAKAAVRCAELIAQIEREGAPLH